MSAISSRGLARVHAGGRFVEQQQARAGGQRAGDLQAPPVGVGQRDRRPIARAAPAATRTVAAVPVARRSAAAFSARAPGSASMIASSPPRVRGTMPASTFSSTVIWLNRRWFWNVRAMPQRVTRCGGRRADVGVLGEADRAGRRRMDAGQDIEECRLARAVRADDADDLARLDIEVDGLQRMQAAEILAQSAHLAAAARGDRATS